MSDFPKHTRTLLDPSQPDQLPAQPRADGARDVLRLYVHPPRDKHDASPALYACGRNGCGTTYRSEQHVLECSCRPRACQECGEPVQRRFWLVCDPCSKRKREDKERARMEGAKQLTYTEWQATRAEDEMLTDGENFYPEWPDYLDSDVTKLWATKFQPLTLGEDDVLNMLQTVAEEHHEEILADLDVDALVSAVSAWMAQQGTLRHRAEGDAGDLVPPGSWYQDETRLVLGPLLCNGYCSECSTDLIPDGGPNTVPDEDSPTERSWQCPKCEHTEPDAPLLEE